MRQLSNPIVDVRQLSKRFRGGSGPVWAVRDVSFQIQAGEVFGLFGSNGAGKSTIIRILSTLLAATAGTAVVNGWDVQAQPARVRASIGLVAPDERSFYGRLTARQNLAFYAAMQNVPRREVRARVDAVLDLFGLGHKGNATFQGLSTGQRQRLNMARALVHDPPVLFLDEPTKSMDVQTSDFVKELILQELVRRQGKTVIFISHELYEMDSFCDYVVILADGVVRAEGTPQVLSTAVPRRALYRVVVEGDATRILAAWRALEGVETAVEVSRGLVQSTFDLTLADEASATWLRMLQVVGEYGGRVESYRRVDDGSLRQVIKHFTDLSVIREP
ncbi:MAG: ABC transporter ATP-binding protein [Anaerolineales bacterium]|nr:ABC transporter ATP-binding protein [Anaerolineales bacterium]